jgi:acyl dehydratase
VSGPRVDVEESTYATTRDIPLDRLDEFVGKEIGVSGWHRIDQEQVDLFAKATGDHMWFHVDVERAEREMGGTIAHGFMTLSIIPMLWHEVGRITGYKSGYNYGCDKVRFTAPVKTGARVRLRASMLPPEHRGDGIITPVRCVIEVEGEERPALVCDWREIFYV